MSDGTTATQVSPALPTEEDMSKARQIVQQGLDAIIGMTQLSAQVKDLEGRMQALSNDLDYLRNRNKTLDELVTSTREARDRAIGELNDTKASLSQVQSALSAADSAIRDKDTEIENLHSRLKVIEADRDAWEKQAIEADTELSKATETIHKFRDLLKPFEPVPEPTPAPTQYAPAPQAPTPTPETNPSPEPEPNPSYQAPQEQPAPQPAEAPPVDWDKPHYWNSTLGRYVNN